MSVLDRIPEETRSRTGWSVPIIVSIVVGWFVPSTEHVLDQSERYWTSGMILSGFVAGLLWQWYSPRELSERLLVPTVGVLAFALLLLVPMGEWSAKGQEFTVWFPIGVVTGLVFMSWRQRVRV